MTINITIGVQDMSDSAKAAVAKEKTIIQLTAPVMDKLAMTHLGYQIF